MLCLSLPTVSPFPANTGRIETSFAERPLEITIGGKAYVSGPLAPITPAPDDNTGLGRGSTGDTTDRDPEVDANDVFLVIAVVLGVLALLVVGFAQRARQMRTASHNTRTTLSTPVMAPWADSIIINRARSSTANNAHCKLCLGAVPVPLCNGAIVHPKHWLPGPASSQWSFFKYKGFHGLLDKSNAYGRSLTTSPAECFCSDLFSFQITPPEHRHPATPEQQNRSLRPFFGGSLLGHPVLIIATKCR